ncbi:MAG: apolipoprotein N-acyltransferase [Ignavibacteriaceae bacterium]
MKLFFRKNRIQLTPDEKTELRRQRLLLILSGLLLGLSFPPLPVPQLLLFGLVPYFYVLESRDKLIKINQATYLMAFIFGLVTLYWVGSWQSTADPFLMISGVLLVFINPVFFLIPSTIYYFCRKTFNRNIALFLLPLFWVTYEYAYMLTDVSFPWIVLGNGLAKFLSFIQIADVIGTLGLSVLVIYINIFLYRAFTNYKTAWKKYYVNLSIAVLLIITPIVYGLIRVYTLDLSDEKIKVGLIQPNLDPWDKWSGGSIEGIAQLHFDLSQKAVNNGAELIIWPETAFPAYLFGGSYSPTVNSVYNFIRKNNVYLLTGMPDIRFYNDSDKKPDDAKYNESGNYYYATYNAIFLVSPETFDLQKYGKMKLVPFGERVPFAESIPFLGSMIKWSVGISGWNVGKDTINFSVPSAYFKDLNRNDSLYINGMVCYESIYPYYIANFVQRGAGIIAVVTNDSWYGKLSGPYQHKEYSVLRAIENRRSVVRAANGGVSCIINPLGITEKETDMFERTYITGDVIIQGGMTFFTKYPMIIPILSSAVSLWMIGIFLLRKLKGKLKR